MWYNNFIFTEIKKDVKKPLEIVKYYICIFILILHEILDNILMFIIGSLYDKNIYLPETKNDIFRKTAKSLGKKPEEFLYVKLFGKLLKKLTIIIIVGIELT